MVSKSLLLLACGAALAAAQTVVWNPAANGVVPPAAGEWSEGANWTGGVAPGAGFKAVLNVNGAAECVLSNTVTIKHLVTGDNGPGGVLRLAAGANLTTTDWSGPYNRSSLIIVEPGASANFQSRLLIGQQDEPGTHDMEFRMNGGTVNVETFVRVGESFDDTNVVPHIQLNGGTLTANRLEIARGTADITGGTVLLRVDHRAEIQSFIDSGILTAYGGNGSIIMDWNSRNPGMLTITAISGDLPSPEDPLIAQPTVSGPGSEGYFTTESVQGKSVWSANNMLYFNLADGLFPIGAPVYVQVEYLDVDRGYLTVTYDSNFGETIADRFRLSEIHTRSSRVNRGGFAYSYHKFENPRFANRQNGGNDFRLQLGNNNGVPFKVASVLLSSTPFPDPDFEYVLSEPWLEPYTGPTKDFTCPKTLVGKVMTGYQGWFATPNDLGDEGWIHWGRSSSTPPSPTEITIDQWPWIDEYEPNRIYPAGEMSLQDGRPAYVFSSRDPETVQRHFRWMRKHDIDGAYLQRFVTRNNSGYYGASEFVLDNVRKAANKEGRVWAIEYDVSSMSNDPNPFEVITNDWNYLVNEVGILDDPRYLHEDGKPVLFIWGFSVPGREGLSLAEADAILDWFNTQNLYLIGGVHSSWESNTDWFNHYQKYDQLLAWMERSLVDLNSQKTRLNNWGMKILPHAWPGFSWHNLYRLEPDTQYTPRAGGDFYWDRIYNAVACGADQIFLGMFDEYDEATAIMPMSDNPPEPHSAWGKYIDNEGRDPFWYLQLSAAGKEMLNDFRPLSSNTPAVNAVPLGVHGGDDATIHLGTSNVSAGLDHIQPADGITQGAFVGGHDCRTLAVGSYFYFDIDDAFVDGADQEFAIEIEFYDDYSGTNIRLQYDGADGVYTNHPTTIIPPARGGWRNIRWRISDGLFENRQNNGSDFRIALGGGNAIPIRRVSVFIPEDRGGALSGKGPALEFHDGRLEWPVAYDATGWRLYHSTTLKPLSWEEASGITIGDSKVHYEPEFLEPAEFFRLQRPARD
ncbi:glycoside hydrolase family 71/99-like protein [Haloferula sp.]|uniref:glycoside hydrolase family 71/99-like protein n=1 Tax=Haloferula sp. TaxID=2497595 RepID=UPI003C75E73D